MTELTAGMLLVTLAAYAATALVALLTLAIIYLCAPAMRGRWLPLPRLRPGTWTGHDVFLVFCLWFGLPSVIVELLSQFGFFRGLIGIAPDSDLETPENVLYFQRCGVIAGPLIFLVLMAAIFGILYARSGSRPHQYGLGWARWPANLALGLVAFIVGTPIILGTHFLAILLLPQRPHQFELLGKQPLEGWEWGLMALQACLMTPILEELVFRGVLQGWLRRASLPGHITIISATLIRGAYAIRYRDPSSHAVGTDFGPFLFALLLAGGYGFWMYRMTRQFALFEDEIQHWLPQLDDAEVGDTHPPRDGKCLRDWSSANAALAIGGSAMLFVILHAGAWPAPVALLPMSLILGWLAHRTQSLIGAMAFHGMFNLVAFIVLLAGTHYAPATNGNEQTTALRPSAMASSVPASQQPLRK